MARRDAGNLFATTDFKPEKYVSEINAQGIGGSELVTEKAKLQVLSDETHSALKKNVFQHYEQFIETAKDISYLAGEMYQISQMLRDQRSLIQNLLDTPILAARENPEIVSPSDTTMKPKPSVEDGRKKMLEILEKVEGVSEIIENDSRTLLFEGDLLEINPDTYSPVQRKRGYLFNDGIMLAVWVTSRRGPMRYRFEAFYELGSIGLVVNIRDPECPKCTFKLLIFPNVHLLQCPNQQEKDSWVTKIESHQKILRNPPTVSMHKLSVDSPTSEAPPSFSSIDVERAKSPEESISTAVNLPEWVVEIPDDLDMLIAQRNFTEAVDLYDNFKEFFQHQPKAMNLKEIKAKVDIRMKSLIQTLVGDLEVMTPEKILQGGPRSIKRSIDLLVRLGRENQATTLFLSHRSAYIKNRIKRLKQEGRSQLYLDHTAQMFFTQMVETQKEYMKSFSNSPATISALVVWVSTETSNFMSSYCRQLFNPQAHLSDVCNSVPKIRYESQKLTDVGLDMSSIVDLTLSAHIERIVADAKDKLVEAVRHRYRSQDEVGVPMKFVDASSMSKAFTEFAALELPNLKQYCKDGSGSDTVLTLSSNTLSFAKSWLHFCKDLMQLTAADWRSIVETAICEVILIELKHLGNALSRARKRQDTKVADVIERDVIFILDNVCPAANRIYEQAMGQELPEIGVIMEEYASLKSSNPVTSSSSRTTYSSPEYI